MGMLDDWKTKLENATPGGINPTSTPQHFLGQILNNVVGDKAATDGDSIRESVSPIDFVAPEAAGLLGKAGSVAAEAAPRLIGNEMGAIGKDLSPFQQAIRDAANKSSVSQVPTFEQAANGAIGSEYQNLPKNFFDKAKANAANKGIGPTGLEQQQFATQKAVTQDMLRDRNAQQLSDAKNLDFQKLKQLLGGKN